ncbi:MAG: hypothetical protein VB013_07990 [Anaerolineaceae bacterium]|nr:hypothetical protein [Anaerolineaceae bacterium]
MDPSFLFAIANTLRERQIAEAAGKQAAFELQKQQEEETLLKKRKEFLESMKQDSNKLVARSNEYPADVLLQSSLMIQYMLINGFVPDSFKEEKDKEQCILLHKKLVNLNNKCLPVLSKEDIAQIEACLAANHKIAYLEYIYPRVAARERMDEINKKYHAAIKR